MSTHSPTPIAALKGALRYVRAYRDRVFVVKLGGELLGDGEALDRISAQIGLLSSLGIRVVVVHGGGPQVDATLRRLGQEPRVVAGRRVTDDAALEVATMVFAGTLNSRLLCALRKHGVLAVGLSGIDAELVTATRRPKLQVRHDDGQTTEVDYGHVGDIRAVDPAVLHHLLERRYVPVVASLAGDDDGRIYNVNADSIAQSLAVALQAQKLVVLTTVPGLLRDRNDESSLISFAVAADLEPLLSDGTISGGMRPKVEACLKAAVAGVERTHIIDGRSPDALLLELFTGSGVGTMIVARQEAKNSLEADGD